MDGGTGIEIQVQKQGEILWKDSLNWINKKCLHHI